LFTWRRLARAGRLVETDETTVFAPAIIVSGESPASDAPSLPEQVVPGNIAPCPAAGPGRIEIVLTCGSRVIVDDGVDATALRRVLDVLERS
jgi:hypothetical protein